MSVSGPAMEESSKMLGILIVGDAEQVRRDLQTTLHLAPDLGILGKATNGVEAVAMARELRPDVVLMDLRLPALDGFEAPQRIKGLGPARVAVVLTICADDENRARAAAAGVDAFVEKGTGLECVLAAIRQVGQTCPQGAEGLTAS